MEFARCAGIFPVPRPGEEVDSLARFDGGRVPPDGQPRSNRLHGQKNGPSGDMHLPTVFVGTVDDQECLTRRQVVPAISLSSVSRRTTAGVQNAAIAGG